MHLRIALGGWCLALALAAMTLPGSVRAAAPAAPAGDKVDMFTAMEDGQIDVKIIPKDSKQSRVLISNKTDKPLSVVLPDAFAAVPVLAQAAPAGGALAATQNQQQNQPMGGGMGMGGGGMGGMGGGMFNVAPEKVGQLTVPTVCLLHGAREPNPRIPYKIEPIEKFTSDLQVQELCRMLGKGLNQRVAQAAAWHLANGMSWQQLADKKWHYATGVGAPYFSPGELEAAMQVTAVAARNAQEKQPATSSHSASKSMSEN